MHESPGTPPYLGLGLGPGPKHMKNNYEKHVKTQNNHKVLNSVIYIYMYIGVVLNAFMYTFHCCFRFIRFVCLVTFVLTNAEVVALTNPCFFR